MLPAPTDGGLAMSVPRRTPNSHAPAGPVPDFLRHRYETSAHRVICLRSVPKTSGIGAVEALTPSTAGRAGLAQRALPRRAGRPLGPHRPRHLPTRRRVDRRLGSDRGRHAPPRRYDLPGLRLTHHDLTDAIPAALDIAIPRWSRTPASTGAIAWHHFDRATF